MSSASAAAASVAPVASSSPRRTFGAPLTPAPFIALSVLSTEGAKYANQRVHTEGLVTAVCQARGCWMEIRDGREGAHVKMHGHGFSIPRDAAGHKAKLEATVLGGPGQGECEREAERAVGALPTLQLEATGVELL